jgi:hypothetical protein
MSKQKNEYLDVVSLLVSNFRQEKPLLEGAVLFRGSRFGEQTPSKDTPEQLHAHLLPQLAASYTHSWQKTEAFIDTYPINRETTRFYANNSLDEHNKGNAVRAYSVEDVERAIRPLVENLAFLPKGGKAWDNNVAALEKVIKASFYEAGVPVKKLNGEHARPQEKFLYSGSPKVSGIQDVLDKLERLTPENEARAKVIYAMTRPSATAKAVADVAAHHPQLARAFRVLGQAVQRDQARNVLHQHGKEPLGDFITAVRNEPATDAQSRVLRLAQGLGQSLDSPDPSVRARATSIAERIASLDLATVTIKDVGQTIANGTTATATATNTAVRSGPGPAATPPTSGSSTVKPQADAPQKALAR